MAKELADLPLALAQAAAYMAENGTSFTQYTELFRTSRRQLWKDERKPLNYQHTVETTWMISIREVSSDARQLLNLLATLGSGSFSRWQTSTNLLNSRLSKILSDKKRFRKAVGFLNRYSLIQAGAEHFTIHPLVCTVVREYSSEGLKRRRIWTTGVISILLLLSLVLGSTIFQPARTLLEELKRYNEKRDASSLVSSSPDPNVHTVKILYFVAPIGPIDNSHKDVFALTFIIDKFLPNNDGHMDAVIKGRRFDGPNDLPILRNPRKDVAQQDRVTENEMTNEFVLLVDLKNLNLRLSDILSLGNTYADVFHIKPNYVSIHLNNIAGAAKSVPPTAISSPASQVNGTGRSSADMTRVILDISFDLNLVRIEGWDDLNRHYMGFVHGEAAGTVIAADFLKKVTRSLNETFPGKSIRLNVKESTILDLHASSNQPDGFRHQSSVKPASGNSTRMTRVILDVSYGLDLVRLEAWDDSNHHYLGSVQGEAPGNVRADDFLKTVTEKLNEAFPGAPILLKVSGFTILSEQ